ncbi:MAG: DUF1840 family protein, partial [Burkholderiaceae bacterium]|nr:DUF1840 family protein [Burkholderiaceae bacterium]
AEQNSASSSSASDDEDQSASLSPLGRRAYPFLELLRRAQESQEPVIWGT